MPHVCWYEGKSLKCKICKKYPWSVEIKEEKREWRSCLCQKWGTCVGKVYGFNSDRICAECKKNIRDSNL